MMKTIPDKVKNGIPVGRIRTLQYIGNAAACLALDYALYITEC